MSAVVAFPAPAPVLSFVVRTAHDRADDALGRAISLLEAAALTRVEGGDFDTVANAVALAVSEAQVAVGAYRQAAEARS